MQYQISFNVNFVGVEREAEKTVMRKHKAFLKEYKAKQIEYLGVDADFMQHFHCNISQSNIDAMEASSYWLENGANTQELE